MQTAALPWSPRSCRRIWTDALRSGGGPEDALQRLTRAEQSTLRKDRLTLDQPAEKPGLTSP